MTTGGVAQAGVIPFDRARLARTHQRTTRPILLRAILGETIRDCRVEQGRTLREVAQDAQMSLGYLSEIERGQKEASSELLASIAEALDVPLSDIVAEVAERIAEREPAVVPLRRRLAGVAGGADTVVELRPRAA